MMPRNTCRNYFISEGLAGGDFAQPDYPSFTRFTLRYKGIKFSVIIPYQGKIFREMPNLCTKLGPEQIPVQKNTLFDTESHTPQLPVQKMPHSRTKLGPKTTSGAENAP